MRLLGIVVLGALMCGGIRDAEAGRGIAIINTGEDVTRVSAIREVARAEVEAETAPGVEIGIMYSRFGLFWLDIWRWDSRFVLFEGDNVWEDVGEDVLKELAADGLSKPLTMTLPPGLIVLLLGGLGFGAMAFLGRGKEDDEDEEDAAVDIEE